MLRLTFTSRLSPDTDSPAIMRCTTFDLNSNVKTLSLLPPFKEHLPFTEKCPYFLCLSFGVQSITVPDFVPGFRLRCSVSGVKYTDDARRKGINSQKACRRDHRWFVGGYRD
jgi:hypothetical protein